MPETVLNLQEAKSSLSELVDRAAAGEEIVIAKAGRPLARLVPLRTPVSRRQPGGWQGKVWVGEDFDAPLPDDLLDAFEGVTRSARRGSCSIPTSFSGGSWMTPG